MVEAYGKHFLLARRYGSNFMILRTSMIDHISALQKVAKSFQVSHTLEVSCVMRERFTTNTEDQESNSTALIPTANATLARASHARKISTSIFDEYTLTLVYNKMAKKRRTMVARRQDKSGSAFLVVERALTCARR